MKAINEAELWDVEVQASRGQNYGTVTYGAVIQAPNAARAVAKFLSRKAFRDDMLWQVTGVKVSKRDVDVELLKIIRARGVDVRSLLEEANKR